MHSGDGPPAPASFTCFSGDKKAGTLQVSREAVSVTRVPDLASTQASPWATSQGSWDRLFLAAALPPGAAHCADSPPPQLRGNRLRFTLTQLVRGRGF